MIFNTVFTPKVKLSKNDASNSSAESLPINREKSTSLLGQLKFWCECGISHIGSQNFKRSLKRGWKEETPKTVAYAT